MRKEQNSFSKFWSKRYEKDGTLFNGTQLLRERERLYEKVLTYREKNERESCRVVGHGFENSSTQICFCLKMAHRPQN